MTTRELKDFARSTGKVDLIGVANIDRFRDAPADMHPKYIMPRTRSIIVIASRILRGCYRGIDEGTHWPSYNVYGYTGLGNRLGRAAYAISRFLEDHGYEASLPGMMASSREFGPRGRAPAPGMPMREVTVHLRIAATLAGLGEIGWSKVFLTEEFGPRQRINVILTDAELDPDPIRVGHICDRCKQCVAECPGGAIPRDRSVAIEVEGKTIEWADIDIGKCKLTHFGMARRNGQFLAKRYPGLYLPIPEQNVTWREAWDLGWTIFPSVLYCNTMASAGVPALCGARGCIIGCMKHLEKIHRVKNQFRTRPVFSQEKPWALPDRPPCVNHHGFVYNPDAGDDEETALQAGTTTWY